MSIFFSRRAKNELVRRTNKLIEKERERGMAECLCTRFFEDQTKKKINSTLVSMLSFFSFCWILRKTLSLRNIFLDDDENACWIKNLSFQSKMSSEQNSDRFSILTFNILAPCYKRLQSEADRESSYDNVWMERNKKIIDLVERLDLNLICLQEFWVKNRSFVQLYESRLSAKYSCYYVRRTSGIDDGLAIFVDRSRFEFVNKVDLILNDIGNRVGLLVHLKMRAHHLIVVNVHLTFPHHSFDIELRLQQIKSFLDLIDKYLSSNEITSDCSVILCGDFNSCSQNDSVYQLIEKTFQSSYRFVNGQEALVTHLTHRNEQLPTDFIFFRSNKLQPLLSCLIPENCDPSNWKDDRQQYQWNLSDHRPVRSVFHFQ